MSNVSVHKSKNYVRLFWQSINVMRTISRKIRETSRNKLLWLKSSVRFNKHVTGQSKLCMQQQILCLCETKFLTNYHLSKSQQSFPVACWFDVPTVDNNGLALYFYGVYHASKMSHVQDHCSTSSFFPIGLTPHYYRLNRKKMIKFNKSKEKHKKIIDKNRDYVYSHQFNRSMLRKWLPKAWWYNWTLFYFQ